MVRLGGKLDLSPASSLVISTVYSDLQDDFSGQLGDLSPGSDFKADYQNTLRQQIETQLYLGDSYLNLIAGGGLYNVDEQFRLEKNDMELGNLSNRNTDSVKVYAYSYITWPSQTIWTLGMGVDRIDVPGRRQTEPTPKLGVEYRATDRLTLRAAAFRAVKANVVAQQTIEPTVVAGFNQLFDDFNGTKTDQAAAAIDFRLSHGIIVGIEGVYREILPALGRDRH